jgi:hydrogenase maturation protease
MKLLVAGMGNAERGDNGFGCAVARRLRQWAWPRWVLVADFGTRGVHLAYALGKADAVILIDTVSRGGPPGTLYVIEPRVAAVPAPAAGLTIDPARVLAFAASMGSVPGYVRLVGCEPARVGQMELSEPVTRAVGPAVQLVHRLMQEARCG